MSNQQESAGTQSSHALLPRWANDQDGWCRAIAGDVLKNRARPSDLDIDRYLKLLLSEKKLSPEPFEAVPKIEQKELAGNPLDPVRLDSLKVGDGVNALKVGAQIDFAPDTKLTDMNSLTVPGSPFLLLAGDIDQQGHIVGEALDLNTGEGPGFIATPVPPGTTMSSAVHITSQGTLPEHVRRQIERRVGFASELIP